MNRKKKNRPLAAIRKLISGTVCQLTGHISQDYTRDVSHPIRGGYRFTMSGRKCRMCGQDLTWAADYPDESEPEPIDKRD